MPMISPHPVPLLLFVRLHRIQHRQLPRPFELGCASPAGRIDPCTLTTPRGISLKFVESIWPKATTTATSALHFEFLVELIRC